jgi:hypothetical protein
LGVVVGISEASKRVGQIVGVYVGSLPVLDNLVKEYFLLSRRLDPAWKFFKS